MQDTGWYADTAYDSRKKKDEPPPDPTAWKGKERALRAHPLPIGVHFGNFRSDLKMSKILDLKKNSQPKNRRNDKFDELFAADKPRVVFGTIRWLGWAFSCICLFCFVATLLAGDIRGPVIYAPLIISISAFTLCALFMKNAPDKKNNTIFSRRTGLVSIPRPGKKSPVVLPFAEFDGYCYSTQTTINVIYHLYLGHRFTPVGFSTGKKYTRRYWIHGEWEFLQQYMDISMPLPDVPSLEPYRHLDPTTAAYDKQHSRPPHYWRDIDMNQLEKERQEGIQAIEDYPWEKHQADHIPNEIMNNDE